MHSGLNWDFGRRVRGEESKKKLKKIDEEPSESKDNGTTKCE